MSDTLMARETAEIPAAAARLLGDAERIEAAARVLRERSIPFVVLCGRGSSGHAGVYWRYLVEIALGRVVSTCAPSIVTQYRAKTAMRGALFVVISQSGRSPDLVAAAQAAREGGALAIAVVNAEDSPVAQAADLVIPLAAGPERAVAATKSVTNSMLAGAMLVARWTGDDALQAALARMPERLDQALALDWSAWTRSLQFASTPFIAGRGHGFGAVREVALKVQETLRLPALAYSAAELRHGPRAALSSSTPVLALRQNDHVAQSIDALVKDLREGGIPVEACGGPHGTLPWIGADHPALDPIAMLVPAYRAIEAEARRRGHDPDRPPSLSKVTETL